MSSTRPPVSGDEAARQINALLDGLGDWRAETLRHVRTLIHAAVPDVVETWKWMGSPVWESGGILAVGNAHKDKVKLTFPLGAQLDDPDEVFNNGLGGRARRAIDLRQGDTLDAGAFQALVQRAAEHNRRRVWAPVHVRVRTSDRPLRAVIGQGLRGEHRAQARSLQDVARVAGVSMGSALLGPVNVDQELAWASLRRRSELVVPADVAWGGHGEAITGDLRAAVDPFASPPAVLPRTAPTPGRR